MKSFDFLSLLSHELTTISFPVSFIRKDEVLQLLSDVHYLFFSNLSFEQTRYDVEQIYNHLFHLTKNGTDSTKILNQLSDVKRKLQKDVLVVIKNDPSVSSQEEVVLCYPGFYALFVYRIAHEFYLLGYTTHARILTEYAHSKTGIDIHPGATIGECCFIDHGTGLVIGESAVIGNNVSLFHGVTLGVRSFERTINGHVIKQTKRHPTIEDDVVIYANATVLGGDTVIGKGSVIGSGVFLTKSVPSNSFIKKQL